MILLLTIGILIGVVLGLTGAGGSVLAMPLLLLLLKLEPSQATGLALGVVAISSLYGSIKSIRHRQVLWIPVALFGISGAVLAPVGRIAAHHVSDTVLLAGFALLSTIIAARMLWQSIYQPEQARVVRASIDIAPSDPLLCQLSDSGKFDWRPRCVTGLTVGGILVGLLSGFFGVGGGFLIVPFLTLLNGVSMRNAVATSLVIIAIISTSGFAAHLTSESVNLEQLWLLGLGGMIGMALGSLFSRQLAGTTLQRIFALTIVVMAAIMMEKIL